MKDAGGPVLSAFHNPSSSLARNTLLVDAGLKRRAVIVLPAGWANGYRLDGVSAIVFAGVDVNRTSRVYRQTILRAKAPQVDIHFANCHIRPAWEQFDKEFVFGNSPRPLAVHP